MCILKLMSLDSRVCSKWWYLYQVEPPGRNLIAHVAYVEETVSLIEGTFTKLWAGLREINQDGSGSLAGHSWEPKGPGEAAVTKSWGQAIGKNGLTHAALFAGKSQGKERPASLSGTPDSMLMPTPVGPPWEAEARCH